jgi:hypothetical protein
MTKNEKRVYIWKLASLLTENDMRMSGNELADHLNRNGMKTEYGTSYEGKRGIYTFIKSVWKWLYEELDLKVEAKKVAEAFVQPDGSYAYEVTEDSTES